MIKNKANIDEKTLAELKKELIEKRDKIRKELATFTKKSEKIKGDFETKFPNVGEGDEDNATEVNMYEDDLGIEHSLELDLLAVNKALEKMEKGTYGLCYNCGDKPQAIEIKRLKAFPEAETCLKCEDVMKK